MRIFFEKIMMQKEDIPVRFEHADILGGEAKVLYDVNMEIRAGDFIYLTGKVGSGKTSIIRTIIAENRLGGGHADFIELRRNLCAGQAGVYENLRIVRAHVDGVAAGSGEPDCPER